MSDAVKPGRFVLVVGPPRAGKSRTALAALPGDAFVIVPRDAARLRDLPDIDPPAGAHVNTVLWLDGLERFEPALSDGVLDRLTGVPDPPAIVATMRADDYDALLASSGPAAAGRGWRPGARASRWPRDLDPTESERGGGRVSGHRPRPGHRAGARARPGHDTSRSRRPCRPPSTAPADVPGHRQDGLLVGAGAAGGRRRGRVVLASASLAGFSEPHARSASTRSSATGAHRDVD